MSTIKQPLDKQLIDKQLNDDLERVLKTAIQERKANLIIVFGTLQGIASVIAERAGATKAEYLQVAELCWKPNGRENDANTE